MRENPRGGENRTPGFGRTTAILSTHSHVDRTAPPPFLPPAHALPVREIGDPMPSLGR